MNLNLSSAVRTVKSVVTANSPVLLVGTAVAGIVTTGILAAKGGYKARGIIDAERMSRAETSEPGFDTFLELKEAVEAETPELTPVEKLKLTWLCYAIPGLTGASAIAAVVGVHTIHTKRHAAMAGLYAVTSSKLDDYREEAEKMLGPKKTQQINDVVGQKSIDRIEEDGGLNREELITGPGEVLCVDELSGRPFMGSIPIIEHAFSEINLMLAEGGKASLNDFYEYLGLESIPLGLDLGWDRPVTRISARYGNTTVKDGRPAKTFRFDTAPQKI